MLSVVSDGLRMLGRAHPVGLPLRLNGRSTHGPRLLGDSGACDAIGSLGDRPGTGRLADASLRLCRLSNWCRARLRRSLSGDGRGARQRLPAWWGDRRRAHCERLRRALLPRGLRRPGRWRCRASAGLGGFIGAGRRNDDPLPIAFTRFGLLLEQAAYPGDQHEDHCRNCPEGVGVDVQDVCRVLRDDAA